MNKTLFFLFITILIIGGACNNRPESNITDNEIKMDTIWQTDTLKIVERDTIQVSQTGFIGAKYLYQNCQNRINTNVTADEGEVRVMASGAIVTPSKADKNEFVIIPTTKQCNVTGRLFKNGAEVYHWAERFNVIEAPMPTIELIANGKPYNGMPPISKSSRMAVRIIPDAGFASSFPEDARYGIGNIEVLAQLSLGPPTKVNAMNGNSNKTIPVSLGSRVRQARPGTIVYIKLNDIYRLNYKNQKILDKRFNGINSVFSVVVK